MKVAIDVVKAYGHPNVKALHKTTLEVTKDPYLTPRGDCIIGVKADKAARDLKPELKELISSDDSIIYFILACNGAYDVVVARGSSTLSLESDRKMIIRRSTFSCNATVGVKALKAAVDLNRELVGMLRTGSQLIVLILGVKLGFNKINPIY